MNWFATWGAGLHAPVTVACALVPVVFTYLYRLWKDTSRRTDFPPGPPTVPFIGNILQIPLERIWVAFQRWGEEYGPVTGLKVGTKNMVVLNHYKDVRELFDKRGAIYSSRPSNYIGDQIVYPHDTNLLFVPYGKTFTNVRKAINATLNANIVDTFVPLQEAEAVQTLVGLLETPERYYEHLNRNATASILTAIYGKRGKDFKDPTIEGLHTVQLRMERLLEPKTGPPLDLFPWLRYIPEPICWWKKEAKDCRRVHQELFGGLFNQAQQRIAEGRPNGCYMEELIRTRHGLDDEHIMYLGGMLLEAGTETTKSTLLSFLLAMVTHPNALKKVQNELDSVCGLSRLPGHADRASLPYLSACISETLRWRPAVPAGAPHLTSSDDMYGDYFIPKGTMVFANTWGIHRDKDLYESPEAFVPERFLGNRYGTRVSEEEMRKTGARESYIWGAGRRICQGQHFAENSLLITLARILWAFDIKAPLRPGTGETFEVDNSVEGGYFTGLAMWPKPFPCVIRPRSNEHVKTIQETWVAAQTFLARYE